MRYIEHSARPDESNLRRSAFNPYIDTDEAVRQHGQPLTEKHIDIQAGFELQISRPMAEEQASGYVYEVWRYMAANLGQERVIYSSYTDSQTGEARIGAFVLTHPPPPES
ncbi:MAG: hypothetical protein ACXWLH_00360 [Candidatus Saccharimonadales bacterium]